ncbi:MAG: ATP synthase F1 subunit delta [Chloroflexota bacterium]|jgi:F-type H+-transporting ATPase subunit delta|nr:ATP synthase F1 subunit delta [Chloroflexota bacterium]|tara:strand:- start:6 stop:536 length:531 start_codon:yes stop_codon:yes gene_type:complete
MKNTSSSNRYSDAIFEIASQDDNLSEWGDFLNELSEIFKDRKIQKFFLDPKINNNDKVALISESNIQTDQKKINFLKLMIEKNRLFLIDSIYSRYKKLIDLNNGVKRAEIITAFELTETQLNQINDKLSNMTKTKVIGNNIIDKTILGGFIAKFDDQMLDMSTKGKLSELKDKILE